MVGSDGEKEHGGGQSIRKPKSLIAWELQVLGDLGKSLKGREKTLWLRTQPLRRP